MHIHRHHRSLLNPSFQQQENNGIVQLPTQQPDTTHIYPTTIDYTDENVIYSDIDDDILGNQSNMSSAQVSYDDNKVNIIAVQQLYSRFFIRDERTTYFTTTSNSINYDIYCKFT